VTVQYCVCVCVPIALLFLVKLDAGIYLKYDKKIKIWNSLSTPPSRTEHRSAIKIETLPVVYEF